MNTRINSRLTVLALAAALATTPALAQQQQQQGNEWLNKQNIGRAVGGVFGGLLGSQFGGGKGKLATTAVGALAGFWLGGQVGQRLDTVDQQALAHTTSTALETGNTQTWQNPDTGVSTRVSVEDTRVDRRPIQTEGLQAKLWQAPTLEMVNAWHVANTDSNVRGGPGTDYDVMHVLRSGERVAVVGKVKGEDWYMISDDGLGSGFVHASLLRPTNEQPQGTNALRMAAQQSASTGRQLAEERTCSLVTQEVTLRDGTTETHTMTACRQPDGSWLEA